MTTATRSTDPVVVIIQLTGGNDYMNSVVPYADGYYNDARNGDLCIGEDEVLKIDDHFGLHPTMAPLKELYDQNEMALIHGVGYPNSPRSHFRSMDIWHTCEPNKVGTEGWVGRAIRDLDPTGENPVTGVHIGQGLPRALVVPGVTVASVADLSTYGLLTGIEQQRQREKMLERFVNMYGRAIGTGYVQEYLGRTGLDALKGADILKEGLGRYETAVEWGPEQISRSLKDMATIHCADLGTRVFYTQLIGFDTHANQKPVFEKLWTDLSRAIADFWDDVKAHDRADNVIMFLFTEFGRRVRDNGSGSDHGAGGGCFVIGPNAVGGMHGEFPSIKPSDLEQGDLVPNHDFRGVYSTLLEDWMGLDAKPIVDGEFEKLRFVEPLLATA
ncbi:MAG: DUF1501 domain-containing protein [Chloroflexota bacterium]|nr:DUF1501 domain-containing protein [Chloroflexota bacterium]